MHSPGNKPSPDAAPVSRFRRCLAPAVILLALGVALFWQIMARHSARGFDEFRLRPASFDAFTPDFPERTVVRVPVPRNAMEPNLAAYALMPRARDEAGRRPPAFMARLAHGYNLRDCMRFKNYEVDLIDDTFMPSSPAGGRGPCRIQIWGMTDDLGARTLWVSSKLRATDFTPMDVDARAMPFPSIGLPVDPGWTPRGVTLNSLRHPVRGLRMYARNRWNNARRDVLTLLRIRRPAWASDEILTLIAAGMPDPDVADPLEYRDELLAVHARMLDQLLEWTAR